MARSAKAEFLITADDRTKAAFDRATSRINALGDQAKRAALGVAAVTAAMAAGTAKAIAHADSIAKNAKAAGVASGAYQELEFTFSQFGVSSEKTASSLERFTKRIGEAAQGNGMAAKEFERLGISITDANGVIRPSEEILRDVSSAMQGMATEADRSAAAAAFFGREGVRLKDALSGGPEQLDQYAAEARRMGIVLDGELLRRAEAAGDEMDKMGRIAQAQATIFASSLFPAVIGIGNAFAEAAPRMRDFFDILNSNSELSMFGQVAELDAEIASLEARIEAGQAAAASEESRRAAGPGGFLGTTAGGLLESLEPGENERRLEEAVAKREQLMERIRRMREVNRIDQEGMQGDGFDLPPIPGIGDPDVTVERAQTMFERLQEQRLQAEERAIELEQLRRDRQIEELEAERVRLEEHGLLTQEIEAQFREARENAEASSEARITEIREREAEQQAQAEERLATVREQAAARGKNAAIAAIQQLAGQSKAVQVAMLAFEKGKAIADVVVLTQVAAARALAELGPILGPPAAAAIKAAGAASVGLIAAQGIAQASGGGGGGAGGFGGGGSGGGFGGGNDNRPPPSLPSPVENVRERDQNAAATVVEFVFRGEGGELSKAFAHELQRSIDEGDAVIIGPDSRQAMEIRGG